MNNSIGPFFSSRFHCILRLLWLSTRLVRMIFILPRSPVLKRVPRCRSLERSGVLNASSMSSLSTCFLFPIWRVNRKCATRKNFGEPFLAIALFYLLKRNRDGSIFYSWTEPERKRLSDGSVSISPTRIGGRPLILRRSFRPQARGSLSCPPRRRLSAGG